MPRIIDNLEATMNIATVILKTCAATIMMELPAIIAIPNAEVARIPGAIKAMIAATAWTLISTLLATMH